MRNELEWEAEVYAKQAGEWIKRCPARDGCPCARLFESLSALMVKIERLENEIKRMEEFPNER